MKMLTVTMKRTMVSRNIKEIFVYTMSVKTPVILTLMIMLCHPRSHPPLRFSY